MTAGLVAGQFILYDSIGQAVGAPKGIAIQKVEK